MIDATCTWGDGPDVLLTFKDYIFILYEDPRHSKPPQGGYAHGFVTKGSTDLTADEALILAAHLTDAANNAKELDRVCQEHDEEDDNQARALKVFKEIADEYAEYERNDGYTEEELLINSMCESNMRQMANVPKYVDAPLSEKELMEILADHPLDTLTCYECPHRGTCKYVDDLYNTHGDCLATK